MSHVGTPTGRTALAPDWHRYGMICCHHYNPNVPTYHGTWRERRPARHHLGRDGHIGVQHGGDMKSTSIIGFQRVCLCSRAVDSRRRCRRVEVGLHHGARPRSHQYGESASWYGARNREAGRASGKQRVLLRRDCIANHVSLQALQHLTGETASRDGLIPGTRASRHCDHEHRGDRQHQSRNKHQNPRARMTFQYRESPSTMLYAPASRTISPETARPLLGLRTRTLFDHLTFGRYAHLLPATRRALDREPGHQVP